MLWGYQTVIEWDESEVVRLMGNCLGLAAGEVSVLFWLNFINVSCINIETVSRIPSKKQCSLIQRHSKYINNIYLFCECL
jgi:hypothetical protein